MATLFSFTSPLSASNINFNTTNLQNNAGTLNTIQAIDPTATPIWSALALTSSGPNIVFTNASAGNGQNISLLNFNGVNDAASGKTYGYAKSTIQVNSAGSESGSFVFGVIASGAASDFITLNGAAGQINVAKQISSTAGAIFASSIQNTVLTASSPVFTDASKNLISNNFTGDASSSGSTLTLATVNSNVGSFGSATQVGTFTVNGKGIITAAGNTTISGVAPGGAAGGDLSGTYPNPSISSSASPTLANLTIGNSGAIKTEASSGGYSFQAYDVNDATYRTFGSFISGNTPSLTFNQPAGGILSFQGGAIDSSIIGGVTPAAGSFTSLNDSGLTASTIVTADASKNLSSLSAGTTTTVLHGNASGLPTYGAVSLSADVSGQLPLANGGLNANLTASNGGIFYSTGSAGAILAGTATAGKVLQSGSSAAPTWSTPTYPSASGSAGKILRADGTNNVYTTSTFADTYTASNLLYSNGSNTVTGLATANNGVLQTDGSGVPSISSTLPTAVQNNITRLGTLAVTVQNTAQPCFYAYANTNITNVTGDGTLYTIAFNTESFDQGSNFASNTFTAPVTGKYHFDVCIKCSNFTSSHTVGYSNLAVAGTSAASYPIWNVNPANTRDANNNLQINGSVTCLMTASDTATIVVTISNSTKTVTVKGSAITAGEQTSFSGYLVC